MNKPLFTIYLLLVASCFAFGQAPTGLSGTGFRTTVRLQWNAYTAFQPVGYNIYRSTVSGSFGAPTRRVGVYNDYTDYGLSPGTTYFYKISAFDAAGNESVLSSQITAATNNNNYLKVASLDLLIPIYLGGMTADEPDHIRQSLEFARQFFFRNSKGQLNLKFHYMEIPGDPPPNANGVGDFATIGTDLHNRGILDNQYDAIHIQANQIYGWFGGAQWLGQTAGSMAHFPGYTFDPNNHYTVGDAWVFTHEFGHSLDGIIAGGSGFPDMLFNHFPWAFPLPAGIARFDAGPDFDGMALILRLFDHHLDYAAPWDGYFEVTDSDGDKLANNDDRLPFDEADFGSSPSTDDSDLDGLTDLQEFYAGNYGGSNPNNTNTDGDGTPDGTDPYPISNFRKTVEKTTSAITVNGTLAAGEGWQPLVSNPNYSKSPGTTLSASATWDDTYLYFAFQSNTPLKYYLYLDGSGEDGIFASPIRFSSGNYNDLNDNAFGDSYYENAVLVIRSDATQVFLKNAAVAGSQVSTASAGGTYTTEVRIPHNLGPGFGYTYTPPGSPVIASQSYATGDILGINLVALPLANANGNETDEWRGSNMISMNEPFHFYDMTLTGGGGTPGAYCASKGNFPWEDWIAKVQVGTFQNASGKSQYTDFTNQTINLAQNAPTTVQLTTGFSYFTFNEYWRVWIDFNHDGVFSTPDEVVQQQILNAPAAGTTSASVSGSINVPTSALTGTTRMRVSMKRGGFATSCETFANGEVEDYTVNITSGPAQLANLQIPNYEVIPGSGSPCYTNPGQNFAHFGGLVLNSGAAAAGAFTFKGWFSKDQQISGNDVLWQSFSYTGVTPNNVVSWSFTNPVPASLAPGLYYVILQTDADNSVAESNETDNLTSVQVWIGAPDFTVSNVSGVPSSTTAGSNLNVAVQAKNLIGFPLAELTGSLTAGIYLSTNNQFSSIDDAQLGTVQISYNQFSNAPLYLNGTATANAAITIPGGTAAGNYFIFVQLTGACEQVNNNNLSNAIPIQITTGGTPGTYCASTSNFPWEDWIARVKTGTLNNASSKSNYSNFTSLSTNLSTGATPIELTTGFSYFTFDEYWRVWIDLNHDGDFSDSGETVFEGIKTKPANGTTTSTLTGNLNIPASALTGATRMRVSMKRNAYATPCETLPFGEVEDYSVNISGSGGGCSITAATSNIQCQDNGTPLNPSDDKFTFQVLVSGTNTGSLWQMTWSGGSTSGTYGQAKTVGPLSIATFQNGFNFTIADAGNSNCTTTGSVTPPPPCSGTTPPGNYCASQGDFPWEDWIARVKLNTLDNSSGKSKYSNFTGLNTTLQKGQSYPVTLTTGFSYFTWNEYWRVWIDYNHDGVFSTPDEVVQQQILTAPAAGTATASVTGSINISLGALTGSTRMRVSMKRGAYASSCETFANGEVEDYTIIISNRLGGSELDERAEDLSFNAVAEMSGVRLYGAYFEEEGVVEVVFEKSTDGETFLPLEVQPGETSAVVQTLDESPAEGFNYYRMLLQLTGSEVKISPVRVVSFEAIPDFTVFPNPAIFVAHLNLEKLLGKPVHLKLLNAQGILVKNIVLDEVQSPVLDIPLDQTPSGLYFLWLESPGRRAVSKPLVVDKGF